MSNTKIGIMQPYFMPYIGYWQLINAVDKFVLFDDVNYIKKGWINRNRILNNGTEYLFTLPLKKASQNRYICDHEFVDMDGRDQLWKVIYNTYHKSPEWDNVKDLLEGIINFPTNNLVEYIRNSIEKTCAYIGINTQILLSSELDNQKELKAQEKIIDICKLLHADTYINPSGGTELYDFDRFQKEGMELCFIRPDIVEYKQFDNEFVGGLSIIDMLCFLDKESINRHLGYYELLKK